MRVEPQYKHECPTDCGRDFETSRKARGSDYGSEVEEEGTCTQL